MFSAGLLNPGIGEVSPRTNVAAAETKKEVLKRRALEKAPETETRGQASSEGAVAKYAGLFGE